MGLGGTGTPKRSWPKQARRKRITLTSRNFLSPLDTGPSRRLPEGLRPAVETHGPPPVRGGCLRRHAALAHRGGGARQARSPHVAQTAPFGRVATGGTRGTTPPPACGALWKMTQLGKRARTTPRQAAGGLRRGPQAPAWGLAARKGAVWTEGLADGAPRVRPQAAQASP